jgi:cephalosporin hydroxylase
LTTRGYSAAHRKVRESFVNQRAGYGPPAPGPFFQGDAEFEQLLEVYREAAPKRVLEIGTYHGGSLFHWLQNAVKGATVVSLDSYKVGPDNRHLYNDWCPKGVTVIALQGDSHDTKIAEQVRECGPYDWLWIDAGHRYNEVKADWDTYKPMCAKGATVAFHDILPASAQHREIQVSQLWNELKEAGYDTHEIVADRNASWGGIGWLTV